jgi:hypothetical protein
MTSPAEVAKHLQDAIDTQPPIISQPNDDNLLALKEKLLDVLQTISYDRADGFHYVVGVMQTESAYMADHKGNAFPIPKCLGLWDSKIAKDATVVKMKKAKAIHKACAKDYEVWKTAEDGCKKLIHAAVEEVYINKLKDGTTFFYKVFARDLLEHLEKNSTSLPTLDIIALCSNMLLLYKNAASMLDFILAMEEAQKKAKRAELPILDIKFAMYAATSILQLGNYKKETGKWEGCNAAMKTWSKLKQAYLAAFARGVNHQHVGATDEPFSQAANLVTLPAAHDVMGTLAGLLDNLRLWQPPTGLLSNNSRRQISREKCWLQLKWRPTKSSPIWWLATTLCLRDAVASENVGATMPVMAPKQFGATTTGCKGTRHPIPVKPEM